MGEIFITIFVLIAIVALAMMGFIAWVAFAIIRAVTRTIWSFRREPARPAVRQVLPPPPPLPPAMQNVPPRNQTAESRCPRDNCRHVNPPEAQFCRRCGMNLVDVQAHGRVKGRVLAGA